MTQEIKTMTQEIKTMTQETNTMPTYQLVLTTQHTFPLTKVQAEGVKLAMASGDQVVVLTGMNIELSRGTKSVAGSVDTFTKSSGLADLVINVRQIAMLIDSSTYGKTVTL